MADNTKRITDVDYLESLNGSESFFVNRNNSIKQIDKNNIVFDVSNGGTGATSAAVARTNLGVYSTDEVDEKINEKYILSTEDLTAGTSELMKGTLYFVYEVEEAEE